MLGRRTKDSPIEVNHHLYGGDDTVVEKKRYERLMKK